MCCASEHTWGREGCGLSYSRAIPPVGEGPCGVFQTYGCLAAAPGGACRVGWVCKAGPQGFGGPPGNLPAGQGGERGGCGGVSGRRRTRRLGLQRGREERAREGEGEEESRREGGGQRRRAALSGLHAASTVGSAGCRCSRVTRRRRGGSVSRRGGRDRHRSERWAGSDSRVRVELLLRFVVLGEAGRGDDELPDAAGAAEPLTFGEGLGKGAPPRREEAVA